MSSETLIEWTTPGGKKRVLIERTSSGNFRYREEHFVTVDETADGGGIYDFWEMMGASGLYPSVLDAQNDAAREFAWLAALLEDVSRGPPAPPSPPAPPAGSIAPAPAAPRPVRHSP